MPIMVTPHSEPSVGNIIVLDEGVQLVREAYQVGHHDATHHCLSGIALDGAASNDDVVSYGEVELWRVAVGLSVAVEFAVLDEQRVAIVGCTGNGSLLIV